MTPSTKVFSEYVDARETVKTRFCFCRMYSDIFSSVAKDAELCYNLSVNTEEKKITFVYALIFLISLTFCFSGCQTNKKEIYLFSKGDFNYSEKITFKMGSCKQEKNWELYLRDEARRVKVDEEKLLKAEYIYRVQINLDADILNKTFPAAFCRFKCRVPCRSRKRRYNAGGRCASGRKKGCLQPRGNSFSGAYGSCAERRRKLRAVQKLSVAFPEQFACFFRVEYVCGSFGKSACKKRRFRLV